MFTDGDGFVRYREHSRRTFNTLLCVNADDLEKRVQKKLLEWPQHHVPSCRGGHLSVGVAVTTPFPYYTGVLVCTRSRPWYSPCNQTMHPKEVFSINTQAFIKMPIIKLNVGGKLFATTYETLDSEASMLSALVKNANPAQNFAGALFIDRDYTVFHYILNFLRGSSVLPKKHSTDFELLLEESQYYGIDRLHRCLYHMNNALFMKYDLVFVNNIKCTVIEADDHGYIVSKNKKRFRIHSTDEISATNIEINDSIIMYKDTKWVNVTCIRIPSANSDYFVVKMPDGSEIPANKQSNCLRF